MPERCAICGVLLNPVARPPKATCEWGNCVHEYRRRIWAEPGVRACLVCGRRIRPGVVGDTCGGDYCRQELDSRLYRVRRKLAQREAQEAAAQMIGVHLQQTHEAPPNARTAVLPAHDRRIGPQQPERRTQFAEKLAGIMDEAIAHMDGATGDPPYPEAPAGPGDALARAACGSCRGLCCKHGEPHAFICASTLRRYLKLHPEQSPAQALGTYLDHIPGESTAGSCIYHGRKGCTLPRAMRSDTCNRFICDDLERLQKAVVAEPVIPPIVAVGFDEDRLVRVSLIQTDVVTTISEDPPAPQLPA